jgi:tRNA (cmo5U34)-methyltransferase
MNKNPAKGFDRIAFMYDAMTCIMSFNQINRSQCVLLSHLSVQLTGLIIGGGTGYFLQKLLETNKTIHVTYVDASEKMIELSRKRIAENVPDALGRITFMCKRIEEFEFGTYDVIVCNYFLDMLEESYIETLGATFKKQLHSNGLLYVTDFTIPEQNFLLRWCTVFGLKILYRLHRLVINLRTDRLPAIEKIFKQEGFSIVRSKAYLKGILMCHVYRTDD